METAEEGEAVGRVSRGVGDIGVGDIGVGRAVSSSAREETVEVW